MHLMKMRAALAALAVALAGAVSADPIVTSIDRTFGSGSNAIFFVFDWNDGPSDSLTWQLNYNPDDYTNVYEALQALEMFDSALTLTFQDFGWGAFLDGMAFYDPPTSHGVVTSTSAPPRDWISFWSGPASGSSWTMSMTGVSGTAVVDGQAYGFNYEPDWNLPASPPNAIPEPATLLLVSLSLGTLAWLRRVR